MYASLNELSVAITAAAQRNRDGVVALLGRLNVKRASELPEYRWAEVIASLNALPDNPSDAERRAAQEEAERLTWAQAMQDRYAKSGPPESYRGSAFDNYKPEIPEQEAAKKSAWDWCYEADRWRNLLLVGPVGTGKTHLACAVLRDWHFDCREGYGNFEYISATDLACDFREKKQKESDFFKWYGEDCELLVIDDLGAIAGATPGELFSVLLDKRMTNNLRTVVTTNATDDDLKKVLTDRGFSRLNNRCKTVVVDGDDYRLKQ